MTTKREDIVKATLKLTNEKGFGATSTDNIAKEANVGKGTIYKYFQNKDDLFSKVFDELRDKFIKMIAAHYDFQLDPHSNFRNLVYVIVQYYVENDDEFRYLERYSDTSLNIDKRLDESTKLIEPIKLMLNSIEHKIKFKQLPPLVIFAMTYGPLVAILNLVLLNKITLTDELIYQVADACWESILDK